MKRIILVCFLMMSVAFAKAAYILIPMDDSQKNHLKAYGIAYWVLKQDGDVSWLLNYRGGSFMIKDLTAIENECKIRGVSFTVIADGQADAIIQEIANPEVNMDVVKLQKAPKIAVYSPKNKLPWMMLLRLS
jgi:hypothetical protein